MLSLCRKKNVLQCVKKADICGAFLVYSFCFDIRILEKERGCEINQSFEG